MSEANIKVCYRWLYIIEFGHLRKIVMGNCQHQIHQNYPRISCHTLQLRSLLLYLIEIITFSSVFVINWKAIAIYM